MTEPIRILIVEDLLSDAELARREINQALGSCLFQQVKIQEEFLAALTSFQPALIISAYRLAQLNGLTVLKLAQEWVPLTPVIIWTASQNEDIAVECMKVGAADYVIKEHSKRLGAAVGHALEVKQLRQEHQRVLAALHESEERYRLFFANSIDANLITSPDGPILAVNPAACRIFGWTEAELIQLGRYDLVDRTDPRLAPALAERARTGHFRGELTFIRRDGTKFPGEIFSAIFQDKDERFRTSMMIRDITERKRAEAQLQAAERFAQATIDALAEHLCVLDEEGVILAVNRAWRQFAEANPPVPANYGIGVNYLALCDRASGPDAVEAAPFAAGIRAVMRKEVEAFSLEYPCPSASAERWFIAQVTRFLGAGPLHLVVSHQNITERKQAEETLRERHAHAQSLLRLSKNLERAQTFAEVLDAAQAEVKQIIGYQSLWVYLFSEDRKYAHFLTASGQTLAGAVNQAGALTLTIQGDRMLEEIAAAREMVIVEDARSDERTDKEIVARLGNRTIVNVPIILFNRHLGAVGTGTFGVEGVRVPTQSEQEYLEAMASHMAVVLDRIHLLVERQEQTVMLQHYADRLQGLYEIEQAILTAQSPAEIGQAALNRLQQQLPCRRSSIALFDFERNESIIFVSLSDGETAIRPGMRFPLSADWLNQLKTGQVRVANDALALANCPPVVSLLIAEGMRAYLNAPLIAQGELIGALNLAADSPDVFNAAEVEIVSEVATSLAVALQQAHLLEAEQVARRQLRSLTQQLVTAQEEERRRLSRELHDEAGQALTSLKMSLELLQVDMPAGLDSFRQRLERLISLTDTTLEQIRLLAQALRPPALDAVGLSPTLDSLCRNFAQNTNLVVDYSGDNLPQLPEAIKITLYRVLQETLTNIARHARANRVEVILQNEGSAISLMVSDDGQGFQVPVGTNQPDRLGLIGMQERLALLGGQLQIESNPGQGLCLLARVPYPEERV